MTNERAHEAPDIRNSILRLLKQERSASIAQLADRLKITYEAVRQHVVQMERDGWVERRIQRRGIRRVGRPTASYSLTASGDHLFPKSYDALASELLESVGEQLGRSALETILSHVTDVQVARLEPALRGRALVQRLEAVRGFYTSNDPFMDLQPLPDGNFRLIEQNCPFLNVAAEHPDICTTTVAALSRLLGCEVEREETFQEGNRRCVFLVRADRPIESGILGQTAG
jgi:predicted ArsR family transcriptional regulator